MNTDDSEIWETEDEDEEGDSCESCGCNVDLVFDDDGRRVCCDCLFEEETYDANQP